MKKFLQSLVLAAALVSASGCAFLDMKPGGGPECVADDPRFAAAFEGFSLALAELGGPLEGSLSDDKAIASGFSAFDVLLTAVDGRVTSGRYVPGSPKALSVQRDLKAILGGLNALSAAQRAGSTSDYSRASEELRRAFDALKTTPGVTCNVE